MFVSSLIREGEIYTMKQLVELLGYQEAAFYRGVFTPKKFHSILLFVTEIKTNDKPQYDDLLIGHELNWDGEAEGRSDNRIINHVKNGDEILLFYRKHKTFYLNYGFRFEGRFAYVSHKSQRPTHFIFHKID